MAAKKPTAKKPGRPATKPHPLDEGIVEKLCARLIAGEGIRNICDDPDMPDDVKVYLVMAQNAEFKETIACAREAQQEAIIDDTIALADEATPEDVNVVKLRIWARQWRASKLAPKKYGEKLDLKHSGGVDVRGVSVLIVDPEVDFKAPGGAK